MGRLSVGGVVSALRVLLDDISEALVLFYVGDLSVEAIAAETGSPPGTVQARTPAHPPRPRHRQPGGEQP